MAGNSRLSIPASNAEKTPDNREECRGESVSLFAGGLLKFSRDSSPTNQQTRNIEPMLVYRWATVCDVGLTLSQHWVNVSCLPGSHAQLLIILLNHSTSYLHIHTMIWNILVLSFLTTTQIPRYKFDLCRFIRIPRFVTKIFAHSL